MQVRVFFCFMSLPLHVRCNPIECAWRHLRTRGITTYLFAAVFAEPSKNWHCCRRRENSSFIFHYTFAWRRSPFTWDLNLNRRMSRLEQRWKVQRCMICIANYGPIRPKSEGFIFKAWWYEAQWKKMHNLCVGKKIRWSPTVFFTNSFVKLATRRRHLRMNECTWVTLLGHHCVLMPYRCLIISHRMVWQSKSIYQSCCG
jgi:hypothetical protein